MTIGVLFGTHEMESEDLLAFEVGYRCQPLDRVSLDLTAFHFDYDDLQSLEPGAPFFDGTNVIAPIYFQTGREGHSTGVEAAATCDVSERWRLHGGLTLMDYCDHPTATAATALTTDVEKNTPGYIANLRSYCELTENVELDVGLYAVDELSASDVGSYVRADARLAWWPTDSLELSLVLQNAFDDLHQEYGQEVLSTPAEIERGLYFRLSWRPGSTRGTTE